MESFLGSYLLCSGEFKDDPSSLRYDSDEYLARFLEIIGNLNSIKIEEIFSELYSYASSQSIYTSYATSLLLRLTLKKSCIKYMQPNLGKLDAVFRDPAMFEIWRNSTKTEEDVNYINQWNYFLELLMILSLFDHEIDGVAKQMQEKAIYQDFKMGIKNAIEAVKLAKAGLPSFENY